MISLVWSQMQCGTLNARAGPYHLFSVAYHTGDKVWFVAPKLKGQKTIRVRSAAEGRAVAEGLYRDFVAALTVKPGQENKHV